MPLLFNRTSDAGGVPTVLHPYVWDGTAFTKNALGVADIAITAAVDVRISGTYTAAHSGLTQNQAYRVKYSAANALGESALSAEVDFTPSFTAWDAGLDWRWNSGSATDPTGFAFAGISGYPTTFTKVGGGTFSGGISSGSGLDVRDRSGSTARLFGFIAQFSAGTTGVIEIDLPATGGVYTIDMGGGDNTSSQGTGTQQVEVWDMTNNVKLFTINANLTGPGYFYDAMNNVYASQAAWASGHVARTAITIPGNLLGIKLVNSPSILSTFQITRTG